MMMKDEVLQSFRYMDEYLVFHKMTDNEGEAKITEDMLSLAKEVIRTYFGKFQKNAV